MSEIKTIGVLTSGGDAPGMNAAIRAVVRTALYYGINVKGILHGYNGLIEDKVIDMDLRSVSNIIQRGGTMLFTARCKEFQTEEGQQKAYETCKKHGIDALVVIGGDGSFRGCQAIARKGIKCIGIPGTIDNDIACTQYTIGYDTALNTALEMCDRLRDTARSHERCSVVEVMGRHAGHIAVSTAIANGAMAVLIPEKEFDLERDVINQIKESLKIGKKNFLIVVAEGVGDAAGIAKIVQYATGIETRATILGHVQRGGSPTSRDRLLAALMGCKAVELLKEGEYNRVVALHEYQIVSYEIEEALAMTKEIDPFFLHVADIVSI